MVPSLLGMAIFMPELRENSNKINKKMKPLLRRVPNDRAEVYDAQDDHDDYEGPDSKRHDSRYVKTSSRTPSEVFNSTRKTTEGQSRYMYRYAMQCTGFTQCSFSCSVNLHRFIFRK